MGQTLWFRSREKICVEAFVGTRVMTPGSKRAAGQQLTDLPTIMRIEASLEA